MSKVQSTFTYTLPAQATEKIAPAAPIRCGCDKLILILKDRSVVIEELRGIVESVIISVNASATPVQFIDPAGNTQYVWRYDYVVEYDTDNFVDPTFRIRKCDIEANCCQGCAQLYTDRKIEGTVKSVLGTAVNNGNPRVPVINNATLVRTGLGGTGAARALTFTNNLGATQVFTEGIYGVEAVSPCKGLGVGQTLEVLRVDGGILTVQTARMPSFVQAGSVDALDPSAPLSVTALGDYDMTEVVITISNPNPCYILQGVLYVDTLVHVSPMTDSANLQLKTSLVPVASADVFGLADSMRSGSTPPGGPQGCTLKLSGAVLLNELFPSGIAPLTSQSVRYKARLTNIGGGAPTTYVTNAFSGLRFSGMAS